MLNNQYSPQTNANNYNNQNNKANEENDNSDQCCINLYPSNSSNSPNAVNNQNVNNLNNANNPIIQPNKNEGTVATDQYNNLQNQNKDLQENLLLNKNVINNQADLNQKYQADMNNLQNTLKEKEHRINLLEKDNQNLKNDLEEKSKKLIANERDLQDTKNELNELKNKYNELIPITIGLDNIGATCYMNATLQSFSNTKELRDYFLKKFSKSDPNKKMSNAFHDVILNLWDKNNNGKSYAPHNFKNVLSELNPLFAGIAANDSKDLISFLLERFHQETNIIDTKNINDNMISNADQLNENKMFNIFSTDMMARYKSIISDLFYGILETKTQCTNCKRIKYNFQVYSFLEFPLEQINIYFTNQGRRQNFNGQGNPDIDLYECFEHYESLLQMTGDNKIYCSECNSSFDAFYQTLLYTTPNYLILNLNRGKNAVYECKVNFPNILNLYNYVVNKTNTVYQLQSVISHIGPSSMSGHFIAYCRHPKNNEWYKYNDSIVTKCTTQKEYLNGMPYILFYKTLNNE
jgi:ubiquitin C-terminal hydrolase